jgi:tetratricopeptide (TPR) repeat protein
LLHNKPAAPAVLDTLKRVLASRTFGRSERARKFLRYLVEQEQAGQAERLKGFTIAVDVFGRDADFDSSADAVVRVQAGRLRELLAQYFATEGASEPIRISIPRGSYIPSYEFVGVTKVPPLAATGPDEIVLPPQEQPANIAANAPAPASPLVTEARMMRHLRFFWATMLVVITMLGFVILRILTPGTVGDVTDPTEVSASSSETVSPSALAMPPVYVKVEAKDDNVTRVAAVMRIALSGFDTVDLIAREPTPRINAFVDPLQFVFEVAPGPAEGTVAINLTNSATGKVLVSRVLLPNDLDTQTLDDRIANLLSSTIPASGAIYGYIEQNKLASGLVNCLILNDRYYLDPTSAKHEAAYRCFADMADRGGKSPLIFAELASLHLKALTEGHPYPPNPSAEQALSMAYRAVLAGPTSPYAHRAYGFLNSRVGDTSESIRFMRKAYELNTYDLSMAAAYGYALIFAGDYATGAPIMERAVEASSAHPSWWDYGLFVAKFMTGDEERAARATEALASTKKSHYLAARLIVADRVGNQELAKALIEEIEQEFPAFAANPRVVLARANYPSDMVDKLVTALHKAGLIQPI